MLSAGAGAPSVTAHCPRAVLEQTVGPPLDDVSERDKLNLAILDVAYRCAGNDLVSTPTPATTVPASFASVAHGAVLETLTP